MPRTCYIYGLSDPRTGEIRYVGRTVNLRHRTRRHLRVASTESPSLYRDRWIKTLLDEGLKFDLMVLETVDESQSGDAEKRWIAKLRADGARLTNLTDGGDGISGFKWQEGSNRGGATPGRPKNPEFGAKVSAGLKKYLAENPEAIEARRERGRDLAKHLDAHKGAAASLKVTSTEEFQARRRARMKELAADPEWHKMRSEASKRNNNIGERNKIKLCCLTCTREIAVPVFKKHLAMHEKDGVLANAA